MDYILDRTEKAFIDAVAANPLEVQLAMVKSPYLSNGKLSLADLVAAATTLQNYHPKLKEAVWAMPDKSIQLPSGGSVNPSSTLELVVKKDVKAVKTLDYLQSRVFGNPAFWEAFGSDELVQDKDAAGNVVDETWVRWDAKKWPGNNWRAMVTMMLNYDPFGYNEDDLDKILDELGVYPGQCVYCYGKTWNVLEPHGSNGSLAYSDIVNSEGNIVREWLKAITHHVWADGEGLLVRSFRANNAEQLRWLYGRDPLVSAGGGVAYSPLNITFMNQAVRDGKFLSAYTWAKSVIGEAKDERQAVLRLVDWGLSSLVHQTNLGNEASPTHTRARLYRDVFPQNPGIPPAWALPLVRQEGSDTTTTFYAAVFKSLGIPSQAIISNDPDTGVSSNGLNIALVYVNGVKWYFEGNSFFNKSLNSCNLFGTYLQVIKVPERRGDGSFCN